MSLHRVAVSRILLIWIVLFCALITACGGGGGGSSDSTGTSAASSGSVAVLLADGPLDDLEALDITITRISLLPPGDGRAVILYENPKGHTVNILQYREEGEDYMFTLKPSVPAGRYEKIRLEVSDVTATAKEGAEGTCADLDIKLPSGKIDLNPRGGFRVAGGETLTIRLDIDARKSIQLHQAGNSGKCIFRPVIFVDIDTVAARPRCPSLVTGKVVDYLFAEASNTRIGVVLDLPGERGRLDVLVDARTVIFDDQAEPGDLNDILIGDDVYVRGSLTREGQLSANLVIVGKVMKLEGTAADDAADNRLTLMLARGQAVTGPSVDVTLDETTLILIGCDQEVDPGVIREGTSLIVFGKYSQSESAVRAVAVIVKTHEIRGDLEALAPAKNGGYLMDIRTAATVVQEVYLPAGELIYLEGDGVVGFSMLRDLLACGNKISVRASLDSSISSPMTADNVRVIPDEISGTVSTVNTKITLDSGKVITIQPGATVLKDSTPVDISSITNDDRITAFGLTACADDMTTDFFGFIIVVE